MAAVVGFLVISFAIWGIGDIFRGFGRSTVAKIGHTEITIEQFRTLYNDRLQQYSPPVRPADRPGPGPRAGPRPAGDRGSWSPRSCSTSAPARSASASPMPKSPSRSRRDPAFQGPNGQFDRSRFEQVDPQCRLSPSPLRRRAAPPAAAPAARRHDRVGIERRRRPWSRQPTATRTSSARSNMCCSTARRPARSRRPTPEVLAKYFEERKILFRAPEYRKLVIVSLIPSEQARWIEISDADLKRAYEERRARYVTPERRHIQQIDFPECRGGAGRGRPHRQGHELRRDREGARQDREGHRSRHGDQGRDDRPGGGRRRLRAQRRRGQRAGARPVRHRAGAGAQDRARAGSLRSSRWPASSSRSWRPRAPRPRFSTSTTRSRTRARRANRWPRPPRTSSSRRAPSRRSTAPAATRPGMPVSLPDAQRLLRHGVHHRRRRRARPAAVPGRLYLVRRRRDHAFARAPARRGEGAGRGALARAGNRNAPAGQGDGNPRQAQGRHAAGRRRRGGPSQARDLDRSQARRRVGPRFRRRPSMPIFRTAKDAVGKAEAAQAGEQVVFRVTDIVVPPARHGLGRDAKRTVEALNRGSPRTCSANISPGSKARSG